MSRQLTLALSVGVRAEAERRGLILEDSIVAGDAAIHGALSASLAGLNYQLQRAAASGFVVTLSLSYQDADNSPRVAIVTGKIGRAAVRI